jgi:hypothetical protein
MSNHGLAMGWWIALLAFALGLVFATPAAGGFNFTRALPTNVYPRPERIVVADFDGDGRDDAAVSSPLSNTFVPGPTFYTDPVPAALGVADTAGVSPTVPGRTDGLPDVILVSGSQSTVGVYVNRQTFEPEGSRLPGQRCGGDEVCTTKLCLDGVCCRAECRPNELCCVPGWEGTCLPLGRHPGQPCDHDAECDLPFCTDGVCCRTRTCPAGQFCSSQGGFCVGGTPPPKPSTAVPTPTPTPPCSCPEGSECIDGLCVTADACPGDCDLDGQVAVSELVTGVGILVAGDGAQRCPALDRNLDGSVSVDELLRGAGSALNGCPRPSVCAPP